jgi:hypothetical protein
MNFELANLQKQIHLAAREFAGGQSVTLGKVCKANGELPKEIIKKAVQLYSLGVCVKGILRY